MTNCCVITTACNKKEIADSIIKSLLEKRLVSVCQVFDINSTYWWEDKIDRSLYEELDSVFDIMCDV